MKANKVSRFLRSMDMSVNGRAHGNLALVALGMAIAAIILSACVPVTRIEQQPDIPSPPPPATATARPRFNVERMCAMRIQDRCEFRYSVAKPGAEVLVQIELVGEYVEKGCVRGKAADVDVVDVRTDEHGGMLSVKLKAPGVYGLRFSEGGDATVAPVYEVHVLVAGC